MKIKDGFRLRDVMGQATVIGEGVEQVNFNKLMRTCSPLCNGKWLLI